MTLNIIKKLINYNFSNGNNPKYLVIHDTGNTGVGANALAHYNYFNGGNRDASAHYFVDDKEIIQIIEDYNCSWHCGDGYGQYGISNSNSIGIEICINSDGNYNKTFENTIKLTKLLMKKYNIPINKVVRHYDASRKMCPNSMSSNNWSKWNEFKNKLGGNTLNSNEGIVVADTLNVRIGPGTGYEVIGQLNQGAKVKINKKINNFYDIYFGNNGGYVSADYVKTDYNKTTEQPKSQKQYRNVVVYAKGAKADEHISNILSWYLEDCICLDHTQYREGMGKSVYSVGALTGIKANVVFRGKDRKETLNLALKRIGIC